MPASEWEKVKEKVKSIKKEKKLDWTTIANQIDIPKSTVAAAIATNGHIPSSSKMDKIEDWVLDQTGEKPARRIQTQTDEVTGPARFRSPKSASAGDRIQIIGGAPPPISATTRLFGLRMFSRNPNKENE
jgi:hypothetical protein